MRLTPPAAAAAADFGWSDHGGQRERQEALKQMASYVELCADLLTPKPTWYSRLFSQRGQGQAKKAQ
ncbi:hypothetical protein OEZ86_011051 [Tetradesmus obliquus]|nr:hypothetical protein OEZ86_011051 [Tetradesmus obliquus]